MIFKHIWGEAWKWSWMAILWRWVVAHQKTFRMFMYFHICSRFSCIFIYSQNYLGDLGDLGLRLLADPLKNNNKKKHKDHGNLPAMQAAQSMIISIDSIAASSPRISRPQPVSGACESNHAEKGVQPQECDRLIDWMVWYRKITCQKRLVWCLVWLLFDNKMAVQLTSWGSPKSASGSECSADRFGSLLLTLLWV